MATSVPVPMATPTSAAASAGASLIPSPTNATGPGPLELADGVGLAGGGHLGADVVDVEGAGDGAGGALGVGR